MLSVLILGTVLVSGTAAARASGLQLGVPPLDPMSGVEVRAQANGPFEDQPAPQPSWGVQPDQNREHNDQ